MRQTGCPGLVVRVERRGQVVLERAWGWADVPRRRPMDPGAVFRVGSISKIATAMAVVRLGELGLIGLDDPVERHLRSWRFTPESAAGFDTRNVTIRRVLSHTAGLNSGWAVFVPERTPLPGAAAVLAGRVDGHPKLMLESEPGTAVRYTGMGYTLMQCLVEDVTGLPFVAAMGQLVLGPLGLKWTGYDVTRAMRKRMPTGHDAHGAPLPLTTTANLASSRLLSSAADLARLWGSVLPGSRGVLSPAGAEAMRTVQTAGLDGQPWGLGFYLWHPEGEVIFAHGGWLTGWYSQAEGFTNRGVVAVVLSNGEGGKPCVKQVSEMLRELILAMPADHAAG
jgi:CubicO group peptidase (beta-lactamase class C family)